MKLPTRSIATLIIVAYQSVALAQVCPSDPRCLNNPYGAGNPYKPDGLNNPYGEYGNRYSNKSHNNPYATDAPKIYDQNDNYRGRYSNNRYDPDSISNPYGRYGNPYSGDSIQNPVNSMQGPVYVVPQRSQSSGFDYAPVPNLSGKQTLGAVVVMAGAVLVGMALKAIFEGVSSAAKNTTDSLNLSPSEEKPNTSTSPIISAEKPTQNANDIHVLTPLEKRLLGKLHLVSTKHGDLLFASLYLHEAAAEGDVISHFLLATMYMEGKGVAKNLETAFSHFKTAADGGHEPSQVMVGDWAFSGKGTSRNYKLAFKYYLMAAEAGSANGAANAGACYFAGNGVNRDFNEAKRWLEVASNGGSKIADYYLGIIEFQGLSGGKANPSTGLTYLKRAADELDLPPATYSVGYAYQSGIGIERDMKTAADYYQRAANKNFAPSFYALASMYEHGEGVERNNAEAVRLYNAAGNAGVSGAKMKAKLLERTQTEN